METTRDDVLFDDTKKKKNLKSIITDAIFSILNSSYEKLSDITDIEALVKSNDYDVNKLIKAQTVKAGAVGFATGLPGFIALPATIPANFASNIYNKIRMIAGIAYIRGYDLQQDKVKIMVLACLLGSQAAPLFKEVTTKATTLAIKQVATVLGKRLAGKTTGKITGKTLQLVTGRGLPLIGGVIAGTIDTVSTYAMGKIAKKVFPEQNIGNVRVETNPANDDDIVM